MIPTDRCSRKRFTTRVIVSLSRSLRPQLTVPYSEYECLNQWASTFWTVGLYSNQVTGPCVHTTPHFFRCHPNLDDEVNHNIVESEIEGSAWGGSMLKIRFVGRGMHLEFRHPAYRTPIVTSRILEIRQCEHGAPIPERAASGYETSPQKPEPLGISAAIPSLHRSNPSCGRW